MSEFKKLKSALDYAISIGGGSTMLLNMLVELHDEANNAQEKRQVIDAVYSCNLLTPFAHAVESTGAMSNSSIVSLKPKKQRFGGEEDFDTQIDVVENSFPTCELEFYPEVNFSNAV